jgi:hypothetical protein
LEALSPNPSLKARGEKEMLFYSFLSFRERLNREL